MSNIKNLDFDYIKKMYCRYNCTADKGLVDSTVYIEDIKCPKCHEYFSSWHDVEVNLEKSDICKICQIDNFIRELKNNI